MTMTDVQSAPDLFAEVDIEAVRLACLQAVTEYPTKAAAARAAGIAESTFSAFLSGTYKGDMARVATDVQRWLQSREQAKLVAVRAVRSPGFQPTRTAADITNVLTFAKVMGDVAVFTGAPGIGKTVTARQFKTVNASVWLATMDETTITVMAMLRVIVDTLELPVRTATDYMRAICQKLSALEMPLLIIDEAQHLPVKAINQLRAIHDRTGCGIVLLGNEEVYSKLGGPRGSYSQLSSRVGLPKSQVAVHDDDVVALIRAWGVEDPEIVKLLRVIGRKPGYLRTLDKVMRAAWLIANGMGEPLSAKHVEAAFQQRGGDR